METREEIGVCVVGVERAARSERILYMKAHNGVPPKSTFPPLGWAWRPDGGFPAEGLNPRDAVRDTLPASW